MSDLDSGMHNERGYLNMLRNILECGIYRKPENEEGRYELFAQPLKFDLTDSKLPLLTTKKVLFKSLAVEMLWFISGSTNIKFLKENNVKIWDLWANKDGEVGPLYGYQWRHWRIDQLLPELIKKRFKNQNEIDQLAEVMDTLANRPEARSHMITAWRPDHLEAMSIKPCHILLQFYRVNRDISLALYQRSCDAFLGVPFNIAQYSLLTHMVAHQLDCRAKEFTWIGGDVHIYENHKEQVLKQLENPILDAPVISFKKKPASIFDYSYEDFILGNYQCSEFMKGDVSPQGQPGRGININ